MYLPPDLSRYSRQTPQQFMQMMNGSILPLQTTDPNCLFRLKEDEFQFDLPDATFKPDIGIRFSRTPLQSTDPRTYATLSKFVEFNLRKYHSTLSNANQNQLIRPLGRPPELVGVQRDGKTEVLPMGCSINPLNSDPYKNVHLTPGCVCSFVDFSVVGQWQTRLDRQIRSIEGDAEPSQATAAISSKLFGKARAATKGGSESLFQSLKGPKTSLSRGTSTLIERAVTGDSFNKKLINCSRVLVGCHGRTFNMVILEDDPKHIEVDPPALRFYISHSIITCIDSFPYMLANGERNMDVLMGFGSGDLLWLNPFKQKYSRWNKNGCLKKSAVISVEWSKGGLFALVGFADGDVMVFNRDFEDDPTYGETIKEPVYKDRYMRTYRSLRNTEVTANPIAHYKFSKKAIVDMTTHPVYQNIVVLACDDGYLRVFDLLKERLTDLQESYYGGFLTATFTEDGKYLLAGGEDDLVSIFEFQGVSIFSPATSGLIKLVARLQGSKSWVRDITVDRYRSKSGILYRIGVAGDDGNIRFYEFQPRNLPKVKKSVAKRSSKPIKSSRMTLQVPQKSTSMRRVLSSSKQHTRKADSISSAATNSANRGLSLLEIISHGSNTSLQQLQVQQQQQQEMSFDDKYVKGNMIFSRQKLPCLKTDSGTKDAFLHSTVGMKDCPVLYPICEEDVGLGRLTQLYFEKDYVWACVITGDTLRWIRP